MSDGPRLVPLASAPWQMAQSASHVRRTLGGGGGAVWERGPAAARGRKRTGAEAAMTNGRARRRVRAVPNLTPAAAAAPAPGDVLIAPITDPSWTPLFVSAEGVVVDVGAQMSHAVIVSRELGIPAVVSVTGATCCIPDGALVEVDGDRGLVRVLEA